jgi:hypothetical protein
MASEAETIRKLRARVRELEAILMCADCSHLRSEHDVDDGTCHGGRTPDMKPGEGPYCMCAKFIPETPHVG